MNAIKLSLTLAMLTVLTQQFFVFTTSAEFDRNEATSALARAEQSVVNIYQVALDAELAGGNISYVIDRLNAAEEILTRARVEFRVGNFSEAISLANTSYAISEDVRVNAEDLRLKAYGLRYEYWWSTLLRSFLVAVIIGISSFWAWQIFKKRYYRRVKEMKPEIEPHWS